MEGPPKTKHPRKRIVGQKEDLKTSSSKKFRPTAPSKPTTASTSPSPSTLTPTPKKLKPTTANTTTKVTPALPKKQPSKTNKNNEPKRKETQPETDTVNNDDNSEFDIETLFAKGKQNPEKKKIQTTQQTKTKIVHKEFGEDLPMTRGKVDGFKVYTFDELKLSTSSGGTPLCPFDCECCY